MIVHYTFKSEDIRRAVEMETAYLGERIVDGNGGTRLDELLMDEEHEVLFRRLFLEARAEVLLFASPWCRGAGSLSFDAGDFSDGRDFLVSLEISRPGMQDVADAKIKEYLVTYILYRWFETKYPDAAALFAARSGAAMAAIRRAAMAGVPPATIRGWQP